MRKIFFILLTLTLLLSGCVNKKQEETINTPPETQEVVLEKTENKNIISGVLHYDNDNNYYIDSKKEGNLYVLNSKDILNFIPRENLVYNLKYNKPVLEDTVAIEVEIDSESIKDDTTKTWINILRILELGDTTTPRNKSSFFFSNNYYKDVINKQISQSNSENTNDITEHSLYKTNTNFKEAVDILLKKDFLIKLTDGNYTIINRNYTPEEINIGQEIGGLILSSKSYDKDSHFSITLKGNLKTKGRIRGYFNNDIGRYIFEFTSTEDNFKTPIVYTLRDQQSNIKFYKGLFNMYDLLDTEYIEKIKEGDILEVEAIITEYRARDAFNSNFQSSLFLQDIEVPTKEDTEVSTTSDKNYVIDSTEESLSILHKESKEREYLIRSGDEETIYKGNSEDSFIMPIYNFDHARTFSDTNLIYFMDEGSLFTYNLENEKIRVYYFDERIAYYNVFSNGNIAVETTTGEYKLYDRDQNFIKELESLEE